MLRFFREVYPSGFSIVNRVNRYSMHKLEGTILTKFGIPSFSLMISLYTKTRLVQAWYNENICHNIQAGIASPECSDRLLIALEPEAASIYIRKLRMNQLVPERPTSLPLSPSKVQNSETTNEEVISDQFKAGELFIHIVL